MIQRIVTALFLAFVLFVPAGAALAAAPADPRLGERMLGDPKAPLRIDEYASLACPHCAEFANDDFPMLKADYIDTGKVKLVFHDFPIWPIGAKAAMLARCVPQERYFPMIETLFKVQGGWAGQRTEDLKLAALKQQAKFAGLGDGQIDACLADRTLEDGVLQEQVDAQNNFKVTGTPTFFFNSDPKNSIGLVPYATLKQKIDSLLKK